MTIATQDLAAQLRFLAAEVKTLRRERRGIAEEAKKERERVRVWRERALRYRSERNHLRTALQAFRADTPDARAEIIRDVARVHGFDPDRLLSRMRTNRLCRARDEAAHRLRNDLMLSYPEIARTLQRKDHTSAMAMVERHAARMARAVVEKGTGDESVRAT